MKILITGVSGTVGTAFVDYLHKDYELIGIDRNEHGVASLLKHYKIDARVGDFSEFEFRDKGIDLVIHLAAMKHIDICEYNVASCVMNNVIKTYELFRGASSNGVDILFMSTDKAVEPCSMYGYSKALGEGMALDFGGCFARSGNVIASNGSVLEFWDEAIKNLAPIKITHKLMRRYFISPESLVSQIWEAYEAGKKVIIPKMDKDLLLVDLAKEKLASYGYTMEDYPGGIEYIGLRPGEKLVEKLQ